MKRWIGSYSFLPDTGWPGICLRGLRACKNKQNAGAQFHAKITPGNLRFAIAATPAQKQLGK
jgi:hypothetical protein